MQSFLDGATYKGPLIDFAHELKAFKNQLADHLNTIKREHEAIEDLFREFERCQSTKDLGRPIFKQGSGHYTAKLQNRADEILSGIEQEIEGVQEEIARKTSEAK